MKRLELIVLFALAAPPVAHADPGDLTDHQIIREIRNAVFDEHSLCVAGHFVHINAKDGKVALDGTVYTKEQKATIEQKAIDIVGPDNVTSDIRVKEST